MFAARGKSQVASRGWGWEIAAEAARKRQVREENRQVIARLAAILAANTCKTVQLVLQVSIVPRP